MNIPTSPHLRSAALGLVLGLVSVAALAQGVYRIVGPDGRVLGVLSGGCGENFSAIVTARTVRQFAARHGVPLDMSPNPQLPAQPVP